ncbi:unnamed protein product [Trifolium pratense]|uniref:Uncharacterized protein n=1 Tax=Trifolium pratense TaxID=57577 RepID=A0ACB0L083_TRIPR|nr:unnamed protein product [Trifolium pratense]
MRSSAKRNYAFLLIFTFLLTHASASIYITPFEYLTKQYPKIYEGIKAHSLASKIWKTFKSIFSNDQKVGDTIKGLSYVKENLQILGYFNNTLINIDDTVTSYFQTVLKDYQKNFNLKVTGQFDDKTYKKLSSSRCFVPDIINGTNTMQETTTSFKPWWSADKKELTYAFNPENNVTNAVKSLVKSVFENWSITTLKFKEAKTYNDSDINIVFVTIDGKGGFVGGADSNYSSHIGTIYLDSDEQWILSSDNFNDGDEDLESVVMHQVGHVLGLEHSSVEEAIMYPIVLQEKKIKLVNDDDLQKISEIYKVKVNYGSPSSQSNNGGDVACCGWRGHIIYGLVNGFIYVILGIL